MAVRRKPASADLPPPGGNVRPEDGSRVNESTEIAKEQDELRNRIMNFGLPTENQSPPAPPPDPDTIVGTLGGPPQEVAPPVATPVGGKKEEPPVPPVPEVKTGPPPLEPSAIPTDEQFRAELDKYKPRNATEEKAFPALKGFAAKMHDLAKNLDQRVKTLETERDGYKSKVIPEDEINRLRQIEHHFQTTQVEKLPQWTQYDQLIQGIEQQAADFLVKTGKIEHAEKTIEAINGRGGLAAFSSSDNPAGKSFPGMTERQWFKQYIFDKLEPREQIRFEQLLAEADNKRDEKKNKLEAAKENAKATLDAEQKKAAETLKVEWDSTVSELNQEILPKFGFPTTLPAIAATDTPEEKKFKQEVIDTWAEVEKEMNRNLQTAKDVVKTRWMGAAFLPMMKRHMATEEKLKEALKRAETAEQKLDEIKNARRLKRSIIDTPPSIVSA